VFLIEKHLIIVAKKYMKFQLLPINLLHLLRHSIFLRFEFVIHKFFQLIIYAYLIIIKPDASDSLV
jgi:hypothetical protein